MALIWASKFESNYLLHARFFKRAIVSTVHFFLPDFNSLNVSKRWQMEIHCFAVMGMM